MTQPIFTRPLRKPMEGEKVYSLSEAELAEILKIRNRGVTCSSIELEPGMGGVNPKTIRQWLSEGALLTSVDFMLTKACNFRCVYCFAEAGFSAEKLSYKALERTIEEAADLGVRAFVLTGGEPLLYRDGDYGFFDVVEKIQRVYQTKGSLVGIAIFSDVALMTPEIAKRLYDSRIALCLKRDSLDAEIQDALIGVPGGMAKMERGYENLFKAGYGEKNSPPISVNSVFNRQTLHGMIRLHRWVRSRHMEHSMVPVHYCGNAEEEDQEEGINAVHVKVLYELIAEIDAKEFGDPWHPYSAFPKNKTCNRNISGVHIRSNGLVTACSESPAIDDYIFGNIYATTLAEMAKSWKMRDYRVEFATGAGEYICNPRVCDLNANDLCRGGCATRSAYSRIDPKTGLIIRNTNPRNYSQRREDPLCPGWVILAKQQGVLRPGIEEEIRQELLETAKGSMS